jgi:hypothetical protein
MLTAFQIAYCLPNGDVINVLEDGNLHVYNKANLSKSYFGTLSSFRESFPELFQSYLTLNKELYALRSSALEPTVVDFTRFNKVEKANVIHTTTVVACKTLQSDTTLYIGKCIDDIAQSTYVDFRGLASVLRSTAAA